jgi:hypothetical protein
MFRDTWRDMSQLPQLLFEKSTSIFENDKKPLMY